MCLQNFFCCCIFPKFRFWRNPIPFPTRYCATKPNMLLLLQASAKLRYPKKTKILNNGARGDREIPDENESPVRDLSNELVYFSGMPSCGDINYTCDKQVLWERANFFFPGDNSLISDRKSHNSDFFGLVVRCLLFNPEAPGSNPCVCANFFQPRGSVFESLRMRYFFLKVIRSKSSLFRH